MLAKRIIACLDIKDGQTVKGVRFEQLRQAGDPVELAQAYARQGADELVLLDITATHEGRDTMAELALRVGRVLDIPFTIGGGIGSVQQVERLLQCGADKVSINSAAVRRPELIDELARAFGSQCIVLAIDAKTDAQGHPFVWLNGGRAPTPLRALDWAREGAARGAGEILLTSMDHDGVRQGFALELTRAVSEAVPVPVIASGGAGTLAHFAEVFREGKADAALAAGVFHFGDMAIPDLKDYLIQQQIHIRPVPSY
jgi:imidazole glycerol-phosphate synthase subunit HisF